ncbi:UNVERIFIED_CONTAM: GntR family transcriptional regulator/MocR family aminotransferase [Brevibacillus sp. OAP136]
MDMTPRLHPEAEEPLYAQIYRHFRETILDGRLAAHSRLPSVRQLSSSLSVSKITVETAYQQLAAEGFIESRARSGFYVAEFEERAIDESGELIVLSHLANGQSTHSPVQDGEAAGPERTTAPPIAYHFHGSIIDLEHFPFTQWRKCASEALDLFRDDFSFYGENQGEPELREEIARYLQRARTVRCDAAQILLGSGFQQAIGFLALMLGPERRIIAMEEPGYADVREVFTQYGHKVVPIPLEEDGLDVESLAESGAHAVYVTPAHQYPRGMVMPIGKRLRLLQWAQETGGYIIENDYDGEFRYNVKPTPSLQGLDQDGRVVYISNFSKALSPALRVNYTVLPPALLERYLQHFSFYPCPVPRIHQRTLQLFMQKGHWDRHVRRMRSLYGRKHAELLHAINSIMPKDRVEVVAQFAGLHIVLRIKLAATAEQLAAEAAARGVKIYTTTRSWMKQNLDAVPHILVGFGGMRIEDIGPGIEQLHEAWFSAAKKRSRES